MTPSKAERVVLVGEDGVPVGTALRRHAHHTRTPLHLAVHSYLFDQRGRLLLTRRSLDRATWPGVWSNSSSGHLHQGETAEEAALRCADEELGAAPSYVVEAIPDFRYRAVDASGVVENEFCSLLVGRIDPGDIDPDPEGVAETTWVRWKDLVRIAEATPAMLTPWTVRQVAALEAHGIVPRLPRAGVRHLEVVRNTPRLTELAASGQ